MKMTSQAMNFAKSNEDLFKKYQDTMNHWLHKNEGLDTDYNAEFSLDEKESQLSDALIEATLKRAGADYAVGQKVDVWFNDRHIQEHLFAIVGEMVDANIPDTINRSIGAYTDIRVGGFGDSFNFDVKSNDLFLVSRAGRGKRNSEIHREFKGQTSIIPEARQLSAGVNMYRVLSGHASLAELTMKIIKSIETEITKDTYDVFYAAMDAIDSTATTGLLVSGYTQETLVRICGQVGAWNNGAKPIVMGTQLAMVNVLPDDANYRYTLDSDYAKLGYVKTAFGYDTMVIPQIANRATQFGANVISNDRLWILSPGAPKLLKLCLEGKTLSFLDGAMDNANLSQNVSFMKMWKSAFCSNSVAGVIQLT